MTGFDAAAASARAGLERDFDAGLSPADLREWMKTLSAAPNHVGSEHDRQNAQFVRDRLREWGWPADIEPFSVLYPTPRRESLELRAQGLSHAVPVYLQELHRLADGLRARSELQDSLLRDDAFRIAAEPAQKRAPPQAIPKPPHLEFAVLDNAVDRLMARARVFDAQYDRLLNAGDPQSPARERCNALLTRLEAQLTDPHGLPGRPWFTHGIYAPGFHTGYCVKTLPGVREAIEEYRWDEANRFMGVIAGVLDAYGQKLESAVAR